MKNSAFRQYISMTMILAIYAMIISPLCHLKSGGQSFIEICTAGGIQRISIEQTEKQQGYAELAELAGLEQADKTDNNDPEQRTVIKDKCPICSMSSKKFITTENTHPTQQKPYKNSIVASYTDDSVYQSIRGKRQQPRAPPHLS